MIGMEVADYLRDKRIERKISQKELCSGICSVAQLSRYENGQRSPGKLLFDTLVERLGSSTENFNIMYKDEEVESYKLRTFMLQGNDKSIDIYIDRFEKTIDASDNLGRQFLYMINANYCEDTVKRLDLYYKAIQMTVTDFDYERISEYLLSHNEICIINNIALCYKLMGESDRAINIHTMLISYIERNIYDKHAKMKNLSLVISDLVGTYVAFEKYIEAAYWANKGIDICQNSKDIESLAILYYYECIALSKLGQQKKAVKLALYVQGLLKMSEHTKLCHKLIEELEEQVNDLILI